MDDKAAEVQSLVRTIQVPAIPKATLQSICSVNGIPKTGNKSDLQKRIIQRKSCLFDVSGLFGVLGRRKNWLFAVLACWFLRLPLSPVAHRLSP
jgi:hypothetical protein